MKNIMHYFCDLENKKEFGMMNIPPVQKRNPVQHCLQIDT